MKNRGETCITGVRNTTRGSMFRTMLKQIHQRALFYVEKVAGAVVIGALKRRYNKPAWRRMRQIQFARARPVARCKYSAQACPSMLSQHERETATNKARPTAFERRVSIFAHETFTTIADSTCPLPFMGISFAPRRVICANI